MICGRTLFVSIVTGMLGYAQPVAAFEKRPFTVEDSIAWTHVLSFSIEDSDARRVALASPDGEHFVLHTRRGDLRRNVNAHSFLLYSTAEVEAFIRAVPLADKAITPILLATVDVFGDEDAPADLQWLNNSQLAYSARAKDGRRQAFAVDIHDRVPMQITASDADVMGFSRVGGVYAYYACIPPVERQELVVLVESFSQAVPGLENGGESHCSAEMPVHLFTGDGRRERRVDLPAMQIFQHLKRIWISPSGEYALIVAPAIDAPAHWADYTGVLPEKLGFAKVYRDPASSDVVNRTRYLLVDLKTGKARPLLDAPNGQMSLSYTPMEVFWRKDSRSVIVSNTYLPLSRVNQRIRSLRMHKPAVAEVSVESGEVTFIEWEPAAASLQERLPQRIVEFEWDDAADRLTLVYKRAGEGGIEKATYIRHGRSWTKTDAATPPWRVNIKLAEDLNSRPQVIAAASDRKGQRVLLDPNPQAEGLSFGKTTVFSWRDANSTEWTGGLLLPVQYVLGRRYPLAVQTHGFKPHRFLLDGPADGLGAGSAFAAQAFASAGFVVLQIEDNVKTITLDAHEGPAVAEGFRSAIEKLVAEGLVDSDKIGLLAFSRTGYHALHLVARHPKLLRALVLSDSLSAGYSIFSYNATSPQTVDSLAKLLDGRPAFSNIGEWFARHPLYALGQSTAAVRVEAMYQGLGMWETYAVLREGHRPADFVLYPQGNHVLQKPIERLASQGGAVDWLRFWLQEYEDPAVGKQKQYERWRAMRALH